MNTLNLNYSLHSKLAGHSKTKQLTEGGLFCFAYLPRDSKGAAGGTSELRPGSPAGEESRTGALKYSANFEDTASNAVSSRLFRLFTVKVVTAIATHKMLFVCESHVKPGFQQIYAHKAHYKRHYQQSARYNG